MVSSASDQTTKETGSTAGAHTRGPLIAEKATASRPTWHVKGKTGIVASVTGAYPEQDARLFAAATELLDALIAALPYVESEENNPAYKPNAVKRISDGIRAAIAKATGQ